MCSCSGRKDILYGSIVQASKLLRTNHIDGFKYSTVINIGGCTKKVCINGDLCVTGSNIATALATNDPDEIVVVNNSDPPMAGQILVADGNGNAFWTNPGAGTTGKIAYSLATIQVNVNPVGYTPISYFTWIQALYSAYTFGQLIFEAVIATKTLDIRIRKFSDNSIITAIPTLNVSGFYVFNVSPLPLIDDRLILEVKHNAGIGTEPQLFGIFLQFTQ